MKGEHARALPAISEFSAGRHRRRGSSGAAEHPTLGAARHLAPQATPRPPSNTPHPEQHPAPSSTPRAEQHRAPPRSRDRYKSLEKNVQGISEKVARVWLDYLYFRSEGRHPTDTALKAAINAKMMAGEEPATAAQVTASTRWRVLS